MTAPVDWEAIRQSMRNVNPGRAGYGHAAVTVGTPDLGMNGNDQDGRLTAGA
jgi:hypothetical protein